MKQRALQELRTKHGYSRAELAKELGVTPSCISHWENGIRTPGLKQARRIAKVLGVNPFELFGEELEPDTNPAQSPARTTLLEWVGQRLGLIPK